MSTLGYITSDNPDVMAKLHMVCIKEGHLPSTTEQPQCPKQTTAASGSVSQLERVEAELKQ